MYIIKNAFVSIFRNKSRNILMGIIIFIISCAVSVTLAINNSSKKLIQSYMEKYEVEATLGVNRENMFQNFNPDESSDSKENMIDMFNSASNVSIEDIEKYAESDYVTSYYYTISTGVNSDDIDKASMTSDSGTSGKGFGPEMKDFNKKSFSDFTIKGYSSIESMNEFIEGTYTIIDGEVSDDFEGNECLINNELATLNGLSVGDKIEFQDTTDLEKSFKLVISGIYEENSDNNSGMNMFSDSVNTIITNANFVSSMKEKNDDIELTITPTFILVNSDSVEDFSNELVTKGLDENLTVQTNLDKVESATSTISNVKTFSITFLIITLVIGSVVLLILNMINIRERKYEIGVLRTIGMKKAKVSLQFIIELFAVSLVSLLIGAGVGACISVPVSNALLQNEISSSENENMNIMGNFGKNGDSMSDMKAGGNMFKGVSNIQAFDSIDATVDFMVLMELLGIGLFLTIISSISAVASIQRFSPLAILKERS